MPQRVGRLARGFLTCRPSFIYKTSTNFLTSSALLPRLLHSSYHVTAVTRRLSSDIAESLPSSKYPRVSDKHIPFQRELKSAVVLPNELPWHSIELTFSFRNGIADATMLIPLTWLRDSCPCPLCRDPHSGQRSFSSTTVPDNPSVVEVGVSAEGSLEVVWAAGEPHGDQMHRSSWSKAELRKWKYNHSPSSLGRRRIPKPWLWTRDRLEDIVPQCRVSFEDWMAGGPAFWKALYIFNRTGLLFLTGVPESERSVEHIAEQLGTLQETFYGRTWDVRMKPNAENVAYTSKFLGLHQDLMYLPDTPRLQFLHCIENSCEGGESLFADGFSAAKKLQASPSVFDPLTKPVSTFSYDKDGHNYFAILPTVVLDANGKDITRLNWSPPFQGIFNLPAPSGGRRSRQLLDWKQSARAFEAEISEPANIYEYKMKAGECVVMDNHRILHGRQQFNTSAGHRWLKGCYVSSSVYAEKLHLLSQKLWEERTIFESIDYFDSTQESEK